MPARRVPRHLKLLRGTLQPCRDDKQPAGLPPISMATAPTWLPQPAQAEFQRLASLLAKHHLLTAGSFSVLAHYTALGAHLEACWSGGKTPPALLVAVFRRLGADLEL